MNAVKLYVREILREAGVEPSKFNTPGLFSKAGPQTAGELRDAADEVNSTEKSSADAGLQKKIDGIIADVIKADDDQSKTRGVPGNLVTYGDLVYRAAVTRDLLGKDMDDDLIYPYRTALYTIGWETEIYDYRTYWNEFKQNANMIWESINLPNVYNTQKPLAADPTSQATEHDDLIKNALWGTGITLTGVAAFATGHAYHFGAHTLMKWMGKWITTLEAASIFIAEKCRAALNSDTEWQKFLKILAESGSGDEGFSAIFRGLKGFIDDIPYNSFLKMMSDISVKSKAIQTLRSKYPKMSVSIFINSTSGGTVPVGTVTYNIDNLIPDLTESEIKDFAIETLRKILLNIYEAKKIPTSENINQFFTSFSSLWLQGDEKLIKFANFLDVASVEGGIESAIRKDLVGASATVQPPSSTVQSGKKSRVFIPEPVRIKDTDNLKITDPGIASNLKSAAENLRKVILDSPVTMDTLVHRMLLISKARTALGRGTAYSIKAIAEAVGTLGIFSAVTMSQQDVYVNEDDAKSLLTDAVIRAAAVKSMNRLMARDFYIMTQLDIGTADNNLETLFNTPSPDVCDDGLWNSTIQSYNLVVGTVDPDDYDEIVGTTTGGASTP